MFISDMKDNVSLEFVLLVLTGNSSKIQAITSTLRVLPELYATEQTMPSTHNTTRTCPGYRTRKVLLTTIDEEPQQQL